MQRRCRRDGQTTTRRIWTFQSGQGCYRSLRCIRRGSCAPHGFQRWSLTLHSGLREHHPSSATRPCCAHPLKAKHLKPTLRTLPRCSVLRSRISCARRGATRRPTTFPPTSGRPCCDCGRAAQLDATGALLPWLMSNTGLQKLSQCSAPISLRSAVFRALCCPVVGMNECPACPCQPVQLGCVSIKP